MPRPARLNIHRHFSSLPKGNEKVPRVQCRYCAHSMKKDVSRMAKHLLACQPYKAWAADNGGEEPDLNQLQRDSEVFLNRTPETPARRDDTALTSSISRHDSSPRRDAAQQVSALDSSSPAIPQRPGPPRSSLQHPTSHPKQQQTEPLPPPPPHFTPVFGNPPTPSSAASSQRPSLSHSASVSTPATAPPHRGIRRPPASTKSPDLHSGDISHSSPSPPAPLEPVRKRKLDVMYAQAIVAESNQFNLYDRTNRPRMWAFLKELNPDYEPPSREEIAALLMDEFFSKERNWK